MREREREYIPSKVLKGNSFSSSSKSGPNIIPTRCGRREFPRSVEVSKILLFQSRIRGLISARDIGRLILRQTTTSSTEPFTSAAGGALAAFSSRHDVSSKIICGGNGSASKLLSFQAPNGLLAIISGGKKMLEGLCLFVCLFRDR